MSELWVTLCSDTEDNYPNYVPGWFRYGSDYNRKPAIIKWNWTRYWDDLIEVFENKSIPITWMIRVDDGPVYNKMLTKFREKFFELKSKGHEIGIHIHTYFWNNRKHRWEQTLDYFQERKIIDNSMKYFRKNLAFSPISSRMGWNYMSNYIINELNKNNILVDSSAIPQNYCLGKYGKRDNIYDWRKSPLEPYNPSFNNYQTYGSLKIVEMPIAVPKSNRKYIFKSFLNNLSTTTKSYSLQPLLLIGKKFLTHFVNPNPFFYISPWWSTDIIEKIINSYVVKAKRSGIAFLNGFFHASDIFNPINGKVNFQFIRNIIKVIDHIFSFNDVKIHFSTLSRACTRAKKNNIKITAD